MMRASESHELYQVLEDFPETFGTPVHSFHTDIALQHIMHQTVAADFYKVHVLNRVERFLAIEADTTGESSDSGDTVLFGVYWSTEHQQWIPMYIALRELDDHQFVTLPLYGPGIYGPGRTNKVGDAVELLASVGVDVRL